MPFRTQYRQGPLSPTLSFESTSEPQSWRWSGGFVDFVMSFFGFAWICWRRRILIVGEEELFLLREYWNRVCKARFQWQKTSLIDSISKSKIESNRLDFVRFLNSFKTFLTNEIVWGIWLFWKKNPRKEGKKHMFWKMIIEHV